MICTLNPQWIHSRGCSDVNRRSFRKPSRMNWPSETILSTWSDRRGIGDGYHRLDPTGSRERQSANMNWRRIMIDERKSIGSNTICSTYLSNIDRPYVHCPCISSTHRNMKHRNKSGSSSNSDQRKCLWFIQCLQVIQFIGMSDSDVVSIRLTAVHNLPGQQTTSQSSSRFSRIGISGLCERRMNNVKVFEIDKSAVGLKGSGVEIPFMWLTVKTYHRIVVCWWSSYKMELLSEMGRSQIWILHKLMRWPFKLVQDISEIRMRYSIQ
jgi:hypothetical protein